MSWLWEGGGSAHSPPTRCRRRYQPSPRMRGVRTGGMQGLARCQSQHRCHRRSFEGSTSRIERMARWYTQHSAHAARPSHTPEWDVVPSTAALDAATVYWAELGNHDGRIFQRRTQWQSRGADDHAANHKRKVQDGASEGAVGCSAGADCSLHSPCQHKASGAHTRVGATHRSSWSAGPPQQSGNVPSWGLGQPWCGCVVTCSAQ